jgi:hypothetical protein
VILAHHMGEEQLPLLAGAVGIVPAFVVVARARLNRIFRRRDER